jgi:3-oxoacyl-[acyl-carrier protein] reductase
MTDQRVALITGGARGIGRAIGIELACAGWHIAFCYRTSQAEAEATYATIKAQKAEALMAQCDVSDPVAVAELVDRVETRWDRIDAVINCAGPFHRAKILEESVGGWRSMFQNNLDPVFFTAKYATPGMMKRQWGRIISFSLANADRIAANTGITAHFIAKSGVISLSRALAKELAPHGVTVNCISPGFIDSKSTPREELDEVAKQIPAGYVGSLDDVLAVTHFLLSEPARYVTGANLQVSGGWGL